MHHPRVSKPKLKSSSTNHFIFALKNPKSLDLQSSTPKTTGFSLDSLIPPNPSSSQKSLFTSISLTHGPTTPTHRRQPSIIIKNLLEIYTFAQDSSSFAPVIDEESSQFSTNLPKSSLFASTHAPKSSICTTDKKSSSEIDEEFPDSEYSSPSDAINSVTKPDENCDTLGQNTLEEIHESCQLGILPSRVFCGHCQRETYTKVDMKLPTLPFWKVMCCIGNLAGMCSDVETWGNYQEFQHRCVKCGNLVAKGFPI